MLDKEFKGIIKRMFVDNKEYEFENANKAQRFVDKVLSVAERLYLDEGYRHKYDDFKDFLYTSQVDGIAYYVFDGDFGDY